jgi:c-di-AMP phosphodiesterase-like protein
MPKFLFKHWYGYHMVLAMVLILILLITLLFYSPIAAFLFFLLFVCLGIYVAYEEKSFAQRLKEYQETLSHRIKKTGEDVISHLPVGIILYNEQKQIEWTNAFLLQMIQEESVVGRDLYQVIPTLEEIDLSNEEKQIIQYNNKSYEIYSKGEERLLYLTDVTKYQELLLRYEKEQVVIGILHMDNLDEVTQGMEEQQRSRINSQITAKISEWATKHNIFLRRYTSDKFFAVFDKGTLEELEASRFDILDIVRGLTGENKIPITLSIGVATGVDSLVEMGKMAQASLDIALGRGGDQAAVKVGNRLSFYGGKTNAVEKRTRVRARVISHALRDLIHECDQVLVMGHQVPDMDAIGACIGILKAVAVNQKPGYMVLDKVNPSIERIMSLIDKQEGIRERIIKPEEALQLCTNRTLLVVVDTHRPSMVIEPRLIHISKRIMVIDHHRRAEEFIEDPVLIYLEPYASSTCELVTELLQYHSERLTMDPLEATALLAGIVVDTRSFTYRTGARTFEAASFLRRMGADGALVQRLLKEDLNQFVMRAQLVANAEMHLDQMAISTGKIGDRYDQILIAQAADTLLDMNGVRASFVIAQRNDGPVVISARSLGEINVQVIMEELGGGGHLTNAATQLKNITIPEAKEKLLEILKKHYGQGGKEA